MRIDSPTRAILLAKYTEYANFELSQRTFMENEMQTRLSVKDPGEVPSGYTTVKLLENR